MVGTTAKETKKASEVGEEDDQVDDSENQRGAVEDWVEGSGGCLGRGGAMAQFPR